MAGEAEGREITLHASRLTLHAYSQEALPEPSRIGGEIPVPPCEGGIQEGPDGPAAWHASASSKSPRRDNQIPRLVPQTDNGSSVVRGLVSTRRGSEGSGTNALFWPGACATRL